jgi:hypothetical protein
MGSDQRHGFESILARLDGRGTRRGQPSGGLPGPIPTPTTPIMAGRWTWPSRATRSYTARRRRRSHGEARDGERCGAAQRGPYIHAGLASIPRRRARVGGSAGAAAGGHPAARGHRALEHDPTSSRRWPVRRGCPRRPRFPALGSRRRRRPPISGSMRTFIGARKLYRKGPATRRNGTRVYKKRRFPRRRGRRPRSISNAALVCCRRVTTRQ